METKVNISQNLAKDSSEILTSRSNEMGLSTVFNYNGNSVSFIKTNYGVLVNATDMAKIFNKKPIEYLRLPSVKELVKSMVGFLHISENQIVRTLPGSPENGGGTWVHEDLAIDLAKWLSVDFRMWCNAKIKELLTTGVAAMPNFSDPVAAARAWADAEEKRRIAEKAERLALEAKAMTVMITLKGFIRLEELSRKKRSLFERYGKFHDK